MQPWQIKALELESSALKHLDGFIHEHALCFLIGAIYLSRRGNLPFAGFTGVGIERGIATERRKIHAPCLASHYHPPAGTTTATAGPIPAISGNIAG